MTIDLDALEALLAKMMTPRPWSVAFERWIMGEDSIVAREMGWEEDAVGIVALVNAAPVLLALASAARDARQLLHTEDNERATVILDEACGSAGWL